MNMMILINFKSYNKLSRSESTVGSLFDLNVPMKNRYLLLASTNASNTPEFEKAFDALNAFLNVHVNRKLSSDIVRRFFELSYMAEIELHKLAMAAYCDRLNKNANALLLGFVQDMIRFSNTNFYSFTLESIDSLNMKSDSLDLLMYENPSLIDVFGEKINHIAHKTCSAIVVDLKKNKAYYFSSK